MQYQPPGGGNTGGNTGAFGSAFEGANFGNVANRRYGSG